MYEEEDDDLPASYRRLTAHLQTGNSAFNSRLAAYLSGQVGVRNAIDQFINNSYAQQYPNAQQFPQNQQIYQNQAMNPAMTQQFQNQMQMMQQQQSNTPSGMYRQSPYQIPNMQQRNSMHARAVSIANPEMPSIKMESPSVMDDKKRTMSLASAPVTAGSPDQAQTPRSTSAATPKSMNPPTPQLQQSSFSQQQHLSQPFQPSYTGNFTDPLFTTALPANSQMLLGSTLDPRDPMTNMFMAGSQYMPPSSFYNFEPTLPPTYNVGKSAMSAMTSGQMYPSFDGLNTTLAPSELELNSNDFQFAGQTSFFDAAMDKTSGGNGLETPGIDFGSFIDQEQWNDAAPTGSQS
jgi:hypothetical protein